MSKRETGRTGKKRFLPHFGILTLTLLLWQTTQAQTWKPADAPLRTRWAKQVRPDRARPEYPRPQFARKEWRNLNGLWEFAFEDNQRDSQTVSRTGQSLPQRILVPFTYESALSGIGMGKEVHERVRYRRLFTVPTSWRSKRVRLNFGACDWDTTVWVNGKEIGKHRGGYTPFSFDVTDALKSEGDQEVIVAVFDPAYPDKGAYQPKGKQLGSEGIWYTRTTGIWQTVWLEPVNAYHIEHIRMTPGLKDNGKNGVLQIEVRTAPSAATETKSSELIVTLSRNKQKVTVANVGMTDGALAAPRILGEVKDVDAWTPETPTLYDVQLTLKRDGKVLDEVSSYVAFREVGMKNGRLTLNGKPYFYRGVLDQGFWPDGIYTPPSDAAIQYDVEMTKKLGFNMARKHVKVDDPRWYYWCDRMGLAVWQDMPSAHTPLHSNREAQENFVAEWREVMDTVYNYPCVVHWIPFNENWGDPIAFQDSVVKLTRESDPSRPITDASGWTQRGMTDVVDAHDYSNNLLRQGVLRPTKPKVVGEYGGIALPVEGHTWTSGWGYQTVRDPNGLLRRVRYQTTQLFEAENLSGFVYTQLTDVEQELNGLMTYDRIPKAKPEQLAQVFEGKSRAEMGGYINTWWVLGPFPVQTDIRSAENTDSNRSSLDRVLQMNLLNIGTFSQGVLAGKSPQEALPSVEPSPPPNGENAPVLWKQAKGDGLALDFHKVFRKQTDSAAVYALAIVNSDCEVKNATLLFGSDDAAQVWLNGKEVWKIVRVRGVNPDEDTVPGLTLRKGRNVLLVKVAQGVGGWGISARFELPDGKALK